MSGRIAYITRADRGGVLQGVRLVGDHTDDAWSAGGAGSVRTMPAQEAVRSASDWIADRLAGAKQLETLCLDVDGAVCSWVTAPRNDSATVRAVIESAGNGAGATFEDVEAGPSRFPDLPGETGIEPLGASTAVAEPRSMLKRRSHVSEPERIAVMAMPDVPVRLLIDELDRRGTQVGKVVSIWHAIARAWDPVSGSPGGLRSDRVIADAGAGTTVIALVDPDELRLMWVWSEQGEVAASGSMRLAQGEGLARRDGRDERVDVPVIGQDDVSRLATEWLSWSAQIGRAPSRIMFVTPLGAEGGLDAPELGAALERAWPGAAIDLVEEDDPIGLTMRRLASGELIASNGSDAGSNTELVGLSNRPGRAHRAMYHWAALVVALVAIAIGFLAWSLYSQAGDLAELERDVKANRISLLEEFDPSLATDPLAGRRIKDEIARELSSSREPDTPLVMPVMEELEQITLVLGYEDVTLKSISISAVNVKVEVEMPDVRSGEDLANAMKDIAGSSVRWTETITVPRGTDGATVQLLGTWITGGGA